MPQPTVPGYSVVAAKQSLQARIDTEARRAEASMHRVAVMQDFMKGKTVWWRGRGCQQWQSANIDAGLLMFTDDHEYTTVRPVENLKLELDLTPEAALVLLACLNTSRGYFEESQLPNVQAYAPSVIVRPDASYDLLWEPLSGTLKAYLQSVPR